MTVYRYIAPKYARNTRTEGSDRAAFIRRDRTTIYACQWRGFRPWMVLECLCIRIQSPSQASASTFVGSRKRMYTRFDRCHHGPRRGPGQKRVPTLERSLATSKPILAARGGCLTRWRRMPLNHPRDQETDEDLRLDRKSVV